jgi:peptide/nickel transport system substrate-binding protein
MGEQMAIYNNSGVSRRKVLAGAGAISLASLIYPRAARAAGDSILKVRSYSDIQILDPAFRLSRAESDHVAS